MENKLSKIALMFAGVFGAISVGFGAMGAHFLKEKLPLEELLHIETGAKYQMYMALFLLGFSIINQFYNPIVAKTILYFAIIGSVLFSFSLYLLSFNLFLNLPKLPIVLSTPLGGILMILAWFFVFFGVFFSQKKSI